MKNKINVWYCLIILLAGVIYFPLQAQQKNDAQRADFSGEWKLNQAKSEFTGKFPLCIFGSSRQRSKTMKIAGNKDFITVDAASSSDDGALTTRQEKLVFDGKERKATLVGSPRGMSTASWSDDGRTMTVQSVRTFYDNVKREYVFETDDTASDVEVTEVWKLINDGKSIAIRVSSSSRSGVRTMKLVYDKQWAADYRF
ncbi:MAG: hypothetical protein EOO01_39550 [Chitinophagaceae bacterium]|nr:MAG: hypothetical protein EOO01_39550 [Chitinophagaceae bacterium]